jgi:hypothetical protein
VLALQRFYPDGVPTPGMLLLEGVAGAVVGTFFAWWLFPAEASLVSVFLAAIMSTDSVERLLARNRREIFDEGMAPRRANLRLAGWFMALFAGCVAGFSTLGLILPMDVVELLFTKQVQPYSSMTFATLSFGSLADLMAHNSYVLLFFFAIAVPFRQGGVMLAVAWNASVWGATFGLLARRWSENGGPDVVEAWVRVLAACSPHMAMEAWGYVLAGFAGVFLSKGLLKHDLDGAPMLSILKSVGWMLVLAYAVVAFGACFESWGAPMLVSFLS